MDFVWRKEKKNFGKFFTLIWKLKDATYIAINLL